MATAPALPANDAAQQLVPGDFVTLDPNEIEIGERLREIDPAWAEAIGLSMQKDGQIHAIHVCAKADGGWLLAGPGGHRLTGARMAGIAIDAKIVAPDALGQRRREAAENVFRRKDDPIERAAAIAELVRVHKISRGIDPTKDGRSVSIQARWQKALKEEADDTNVTMTVVYGWTEEIAHQIGVSKSTIERDLLLYRRLSPSLTARLRERRHTILSNAGQLRALAKLEPTEQARVVDQLVDPTAPAKSVSEAQARLRGANKLPSDPEAKRLSAFLGSYQRMGIAEKKGALAELAALLPAGFRIVQDKKPVNANDTMSSASEPAPVPPQPAVAIRASVKSGYIACLECGEKVTNIAAHLSAKHDMAFEDYQHRWNLPADYPKVAPEPEPAGALLAECAGDLETSAAVVRSWRDKPIEQVIAAVKAGGGSVRFANGTYEMKLAGVKTTCTAGGWNLVWAWCRKADERLYPEGEEE